MYKVFANNKNIYFSKNKYQEIQNSIFFELKDIYQIPVIYKEFILSDNQNLVIICKELLKPAFDLFKKQFLLLKAAGGVVLNEKNEILFIFRRAYWDLPKGKVEKNESLTAAAIRETTEETGLTNIKITKKLKPTYHIYNENGKDILKKTSWYLMNTNSNQQLIPQKEEDIEIAKWVNKTELKTIYLKTYKSLIDIIKSVEDLI